MFAKLLQAREDETPPVPSNRSTSVSYCFEHEKSRVVLPFFECTGHLGHFLECTTKFPLA